MTITDPPPQATGPGPGVAADRPEDAGQWTARLRGVAVEALPPDRLLPDRQPAYVASWIYVFGVVTVSALIVVIATGTVLAAEAPAGRWALTTSNGRSVPRSDSFGWGARYRVAGATTGTLHFVGGLLPVGEGVFSVVVWLLAVAALVDRRRLRREWERVGRGRHRPVPRIRHTDELDDVWAEEVGVPR